jgi:hypothetical protein
MWRKLLCLKLTLLAGLALLIFCLAGSQPAAAQNGTYQQSCKNIKVSGDTLYARCKDTNGNYRDTQLPNVSRCRGDIGNINGNLQCSDWGPGGQYQQYPPGQYPGQYQYGQPGLPPGSYQQTCQNISVDGDRLRARCMDTNNNWHDTDLRDYQSCRGEITNNNGRLICNMSAGQSNDQYGRVGDSFQQTCTDINQSGDTLHARCQDNNGNWHDTELRNVSQCRGGITNNNGRLICNYGLGHPGDYNVGGAVPPGSYQQSCRNIQAYGNQLRATCQDTNGNWRDSVLNNWNSCNGDIGNNNGTLQCNYGGNSGYYNGQWAGMPQGSYQQSCRNIYTRGNNLRAECPDSSGQWHNAQLHNYKKCRGDIANQQGQLVCSR